MTSFAQKIPTTHGKNLISRLQERDPGALNDIYARYKVSTFSLIFRLVRDRGIAEDITQEVFLRAWTRADTIDSGLPIGPWLQTVARNRALDYLRATQNRWVCTTSEADKTPDVNSMVEVARIDSMTGQATRLAAGLAGLNSNQRKVIDMAYFGNFSQTEIATRLGCPLGTVKTWVRGGLRSLRHHFELAA